jgi:hypothetical protein
MDYLIKLRNGVRRDRLVGRLSGRHPEFAVRKAAS